MHSIVRDKTEHTFMLAYSFPFVRDLCCITDFFLHLETHKVGDHETGHPWGLFLMIFYFLLDAIVIYNYNCPRMSRQKSETQVFFE